jgi:four helix bundle protein
MKDLEWLGKSGELQFPSISILLKAAAENLDQKEKDFMKFARGSLIEVHAALDIAVGLNYVITEDLNALGELVIRVFQMISKTIS